MHELRIATDLTAIVLETARAERISKVTRVNLAFGKMVSVVPDIFEVAFREAARDSVASYSEINIEIIPVKLRCRECGCDYNMEEDDLFRCSTCGSANPEIINGNELFIKSIEGE